MLLDLIETYTQEHKETLRNLWTKTVEDIAREHDQKKILGFLNKCGIIGIDSKDKKIHIGVPNEFLLLQVKKFLFKPLKKSLASLYNEQFKTELHVYPPFQRPNNDLQINLKKLLKVTLPKQEEKEFKNNTSQTKTLSNRFNVKLSGSFTFQTFVTGSHNNFAVSAAKAVAEKPGQVYSPLFIYGNVGLGKTHLMNAIANEIIQQDNKKNVLYLPATKLIDEIVTAIRKNKLSNLMRTFDDIDVLLIDDIQFLADKVRTQEIFHNIFNEFQMNNKQVVLTSDRPPKELNNIEARLKSRFALGLVADIQKPDYETRLAILQAKCSQKGESIAYELLSIIAKTIKNNVRELEGALNIIITRKNLIGEELSEQDILECLKTLGYKKSLQDENLTNEYITTESNSTIKKREFGQIVHFVSDYYNITIEELKSPKRKKEITRARQMLMVIAKKHFSRTLEKIGDYFGGKNHATVIYALNNFNKKIKADHNLHHDYNIVLEQLER